MSWLSEAISYGKRGWPTILLYGIDNGICNCSKGRACENPGKHPVYSTSQRSATTDSNVLTQWYEQAGNHTRNVGILSGSVSRLVIVDVDPRNGGDETLRALQEKYAPLPVTLTCDTGGGGTHHYFKYPDNSLVFTSSTLKGIDVKADSKGNGLPGYVLVPPSCTKSEYKWRNPDLPIAPCPQWFLDLLLLQETGSEIDESSDEIFEGKRHNYLLSRAGKLRHDNWSADSILQALRTENYSKCKPPLPDSEVDEIAKGVTRYDSPTFHLNDIGNAKRLIYKYGKQLLHCYQQKTWYIWEGRYWARDQLGQVQQFAKATVDWMHEDALTKGGGDLTTALRKHATQSGRSERIAAMVEMARSEKEVSVRATDLDGFPTLLNCPNGTLDLTTGKMSKHDQKQKLTRITPTTYVSSARSQIWEEFLKTATQGDEELQVFLQRIAGYALSGLTIEESIFFVHGPGGTGKSTFFETIKSVMGDAYCKTASFATFIKNKSGGTGGGARSDIARLPGARLVTAVEVSEGKEFATDFLKVSTGGDKITTRDLYQSEFEFLPQYKIWLAANSKPHVREDDTGIWRRLLLIPFNHVVHTPNKKLKDELRESKSDKEGILTWMVQGFLDWQKSGWTVPNVVKKETQGYRNEMDSFAAWLEDCTQKDPAALPIPLGTLWTSYDEWIKKQPQVVRDARIDTQKNFAAELQKRGFLSKVELINGRPTKTYLGIILVY